MINPDWLETTYVVKNNGLDYKTDAVDYSARKTDITITPYRSFVASHPNETNYYQPILDVLDYYPSRLEFIPHSVILEGKNDYYILRFAQFILGDTKYSRINIIPGTSSSNMDPIIKLYIGWGQEFVVILDSDKEGKKQKERYEAIFESMLNDKILPPFVNLGTLAIIARNM